MNIEAFQGKINGYWYAFLKDAPTRACGAGETTAEAIDDLLWRLEHICTLCNGRVYPGEAVHRDHADRLMHADCRFGLE